MGRRAALACTVAVEEGIEDHYARQAERLDDDPELKDTIERFREEEREHREIGLEQEAALAPGQRALSAAIKTGCRAAIWLSERLRRPDGRARPRRPVAGVL